MNIFSGLEQIVETKYPLARCTWYGLGGPADYFIRPETVEQLKEVVQRCNENKIAIYAMGFGSNLLIGDDGLRAAYSLGGGGIECADLSLRQRGAFRH